MKFLVEFLVIRFVKFVEKFFVKLDCIPNGIFSIFLTESFSDIFGEMFNKF